VLTKQYNSWHFLSISHVRWSAINTDKEPCSSNHSGCLKQIGLVNEICDEISKGTLAGFGGADLNHIYSVIFFYLPDKLGPLFIVPVLNWRI